MINIFFFNVETGHYVYIETSAPRRPNDTARILSPRYTDRSDMCMQFYYHMLGNGVGTLNVYAKVHLSEKRFWNFLLIRSLYFINLYMYNDLQISCQHWVAAMITHESESSPNWIDLTHMIIAHFSCGKQIFLIFGWISTSQVGSNMGNPLFTLSGNQGNSWTQGQMSIPQVTASRGYKVSFFFIITQNIENIPVLQIHY